MSSLYIVLLCRDRACPVRQDNGEKMKKIRPFSLSELRETLFSTTPILDPSARDERQQMMDQYVAQNLLVAQNPPVKRLLSLLSDDTYLLPEMRVMVITHGESTPTVNLVPRHFHAGQMCYLSANSIVQLGAYSDDIRGFGISLTNELAALIFPDGLPAAFDGSVRDFNFQLSHDELEQVRHLHQMLCEMQQDKGYATRAILHLVAAFLCQVNDLWTRHERERSTTLSREQKLFSDFIQLVGRYAAQQHQIGFYARQLCISPRYMSTLIRQVSGKGAKQWIDEAIITRAKVSLRHSDKTVAEIADEMNFPTPSFFCKYFKRLTGSTPQNFRSLQR